MVHGKALVRRRKLETERGRVVLDADRQGTWAPVSPLGRVLAAAWSSGWAVAALNVSNLETAQGVVAAAEQAGAPVVLQISPGAIAYAGYATLSSLARQVAHEAKVPVFVHLDHCTDLDLALRAIDDGYDSVMLDGSRLPYDENVRLTARVARKAAERNVLSEGEMGLIGRAQTTTVDKARESRTTPDEAAAFVAETGVDVLAPALGTIHGMPDDALSIDPAWIAAVARSAARPLALHGASGLPPSQIQPAVKAGVAKVNVSSRVSRALAAGIREAWRRDPDQLDLRLFLADGRDAVTALGLVYMEATGSAGHADEARRLAWGESRPKPRGNVSLTGPTGSPGSEETKSC